MPEFKDFFYPSSTGKNTIRARMCIPDCAPKAVIQIAHGIAEHIERYDAFMSFLAENGYLAVGNDHLGHGKSAVKPEEIGIFSEKDGWNHVVKDMDILRSRMRESYPDIPYVFFGHSMGSFLTRTYLIRYPERYDAAILSGTGHQSAVVINSGYRVAQLITKRKGPDGDGKVLNNIAFGNYCKKIPHPRTSFDWLSRDTEAVDRYIADPKCGFVCKVSLYRDMMSGLRFVTNQRNIMRMNRDKPVWFMSGSADPVGEYGQGVKRAYQAFRKAGLKDVSIRLYSEGRHEMLNELNRDEVMRDILDWLNSRLQSL
ncbi:MAG: alpha/beta hydrolase [Oscillospiraceae bacterium]|nr:alpha/beta hydrolase [Oscillospiraceae bacterium]